MAKLSGLGMAVTLQDSGAVARTVSNDIGDLSLPITFAVQDDTGIDKSAIERLALLTDIKGAFKGFHNNAATTGIHTVISNGQTTPRQAVVTLPGGAGATLTWTGLLDNYTIARAQTAALTNSWTLSLSNGTAPAWS
jgi:hypothetical protein